MLLIASIISLFVGVADISIADIIKGQDEGIFLIGISRIPRTIALILAGIGMSISGLIMQQLTQNKFVSPTTAGTLESAKLGLLSGLLLIPTASEAVKMMVAFLFTFLSSLLFLNIIRKIRFRNLVLVPLIGLIFGGIINSISTFLAIKRNMLQDANSWLIGDFSGVLQGRYELIYLSLPSILITYLYASRFTVIGLGKDFSKSLGLNYSMVMNIGLFCVSLTVSTVVITAGVIPFLGLIVPNIVSMIYGDNIRKTLPLVALTGAIFLVICDIIGRLVIFPYEVPIGIMVSVIGAGIFLMILLWKR
ncbi:iron chelate uptake ABC transporter family permease subunit [Dysgonomonas sp. Marseille-P4677]|nr:iron chelate uptake ABC transporter family permease subunit [Dysgonomonas sp. Marseille-P4677]